MKHRVKVSFSGIVEAEDQSLAANNMRYFLISDLSVRDLKIEVVETIEQSAVPKMPKKFQNRKRG